MSDRVAHVHVATPFLSAALSTSDQVKTCWLIAVVADPEATPGALEHTIKAMLCGLARRYSRTRNPQFSKTRNLLPARTMQRALTRLDKKLTERWDAFELLLDCLEHNMLPTEILRAKGMSEQQLDNWLVRVWRPTQPVLHLVGPIVGQLKSSSVLSCLVSIGAWVEDALVAAEDLRTEWELDRFSSARGGSARSWDTRSPMAVDSAIGRLTKLYQFGMPDSPRFRRTDL